MSHGTVLKVLIIPKYDGLLFPCYSALKYKLDWSGRINQSYQCRLILTA